MSRFVMSKTPWERCVYPALKAALEKTDYNQTTLAKATGIHGSNISRYIKGDVDSTIRGLLALEDLTGKPFRELFGGGLCSFEKLKTVHGRIVYINEAHRYFTADADINGKNLRESFKF